MKKQKRLFAIGLGIFFLFAGYNLWSYFETEAAREAQEASAAEERRNAKEREQAERATKRKAETEARKQRLAEEEGIQRLTKEARTPRHIEGIREEIIEKMTSVSSRYITDHPEEFMNQKFDSKSFGSRTNFEKLTQADTNPLMLFSAISQDIKVLEALMDIGLDVNASNKMGYTALHYATGCDREQESRSRRTAGSAWG